MALFVAGCAVAVAALAVLVFWFRPYAARVFESIGDIDLDAYRLDQSAELMALDRETGEWYCYASLHGGENRIEVAYDDMPRDLLDATVAIEDKRFWTHQGVDWMRTAYAAVNMVTGGRVRFGASTITQQLIKNLTGDDEVTTDRKLREICSALLVEQKYDKKDILCRYLNTIYFGRGMWGIEAAARGYYNKHASELTTAEAASLVAITRNPSIYDISEEKNASRRRTILYEMHEQGYLEDGEYEAALAEDPVPVERAGSGFYGWFTDEVIRTSVRDLAEAGYSEDEAYALLYSGGIRIYTTVDPEAQALAEAVCMDRGALPKTSAGDRLQGAVIVIENETGHVAAVCGGFGDKEGSLVLDRATQSLLQPASALKPLSVYVPAFEAGRLDPWTLVDDAPVPEAGLGEWPRNVYAGYLGNITLDEAVRRSTNTVAVRMAMELGEETSLDALSRFGMDLEDESYVRLSLGGLDRGVTAKSMAAAYAALADGGSYKDPVFYTKIEAADGTEILSKKPAESRATDVYTAATLTSLLENVVSYGTGVGVKIDGMGTAGKTGTSDDGRDYWFVGYTPYYTAAVWCGTDEPEAITALDGNPALPVWYRVMSGMHEGLEKKGFERPEGMSEVRYCMKTGLLASDACEAGAAWTRGTLEEACSACG